VNFGSHFLAQKFELSIFHSENVRLKAAKKNAIKLWHVVENNFIEIQKPRTPVEDGEKIQHNSTQTPSDMTPPATCGEEYLPQAHHQNPGHCIASFSTINRMRLNTQVNINYQLLIECDLKPKFHLVV
jgi:hypothetical protein